MITAVVLFLLGWTAMLFFSGYYYGYTNGFLEGTKYGKEKLVKDIANIGEKNGRAKN
jgi:hypothetical protein